MKAIKSLFMSTVLLAILSSCAGGIVHDRLMTGKIVRDCSGTYIRIDDKDDFMVCNDQLLKDKNAGEEVKVI